MYTYINYIFYNDPSGKVEIKSEVNTFMMNLYSNERNFRKYLEIIYLIFHIYFWYCIFKRWNKEFCDEKLKNKYTPFNEHFL